MAVCLLDKNLWFPDPHLGEEDGLVAIGGDLSVDRLILAYSNGFFPWYSFKDQQPLWYCPLQRFVIFPNEIHVSHSMKHELEGAWLGPNIIKAYTELYRQGFAASVEVWEGTQLVGGLYGVALGRCFFGESMFSLVPSASKLALIYLARMLESHGGLLIDCQFETPHLCTMGGRHIPYEEYIEIIRTL